jgi:adenylate kinase family enzyme
MQRVLIMGCPGAGKSTLARQLGDRMGIPVIHLDKLYWQPGWVEPGRDAWLAVVTGAVQGESWIMDGHYGSTLDLRLGAADTVILLDFPRYICLWRVINRVIRTRGRTRADMGAGCKEKVDWEFLRFIWNFPREQLPVTKQKLKAFEGRTLVFRNPEEVAKFVEDLG